MGGETWVFFVGALVGGMVLLFLLGRRDERRVRKDWELVLTPKGQRIYTSMQSQFKTDLELMNATYDEAVAFRELGSTEDAKDLLDAGFRIIEHFAPSMEWNQGEDGWAQIARAGATAAEAGDFNGAKATCKRCHKKWRGEFRDNENFRRRPLPELPAKRLDALRQRFVGDRHPAPHFVEELVLWYELAAVPHEQRERVEVARVDLHRSPAVHQPPFPRVQHEALERERRRHFQQNLTTCSCLPGAQGRKTLGTQSCMEVGIWQAMRTRLKGHEFPGGSLDGRFRSCSSRSRGSRISPGPPAISSSPRQRHLRAWRRPRPTTINPQG